MSDIFLSYAREDRPEAQRLPKALEEKGWSVWWDQRLEAGQVWDETIAGNLEKAKVVLVLWSPTSVRRHWVKNEARFADKKGKLVPVLIRSASIPLEFGHLQTEDLTGWRGDPSDTAFLRLADTLAKRLGPAKPPDGPPPPKRDIGLGMRFWLLSGGLLGLAGLVAGFYLIVGGNYQTESRRGGTAPRDESHAHNGMVIIGPGDKTLAEWTPGCLYEVRAERHDGALRACFRFDPNECFVAAGMMQQTAGADLKPGAPVFVSLSPAARSLGGGNIVDGHWGPVLLQLGADLDCARDGKPGLWVGADAVMKAG